MTARPAPTGSTRRHVVAVALFALLAAPSLLGCSGGFALVHARDTVQRSLEIPAGTPVRVETFNGAIEVTTAADGGVSAQVERTGEGSSRAKAEADRDRIAVTLELVGGTAVLRAVYTPNPDNVGGGQGARVTLRVPRGTAVGLVTSNGRVSVQGTGAPADVRTSNASVDLGGVAGAVAVETSNGSITVDAGTATADLRTSNARLTFAGSLQPGRHTFETSNGALELRLPAQSAFALDAETSNASVRSDFPVAGETTKTSLRGTAGTAGAASGVTIFARTSNADVAIRGT